MHNYALKRVPCRRLLQGQSKESKDIIAQEAMLNLTLIAGPAHNRCLYPFATILRTPGEDRLLILGLLYSLGIIEKRQDILSMHRCFRGLKDEDSLDTIEIALDFERSYHPLYFAQAHPRHGSCGHCGSTAALPAPLCLTKAPLLIDSAWLMKALGQLSTAQTIFAKTGGTHGAALIALDNDSMILFEDVGRHNAVDKVVGSMIEQNEIPLSRQVLIVSSRASYEIVQKAAMAGIPIVAALGAVSSLAVQLAEKYQITLIGFLKEERLNIYTHAERLF